MSRIEGNKEILNQVKKSMDELSNAISMISDMAVISSQITIQTSILLDISESLAVIADKMGGAE